MQRTSVISTNLASVGYDNSTQTLEVEFLNGGIYQYFDVPSSVFEDLMAAESVGSYHAANVKNSYRYARL